MVKGKRNGNNGQRRSRNVVRVTVSISGSQTWSSSSVTQTRDLTPAITTRSAAIGDVFGLYRVTALRLKLFPNTAFSALCVAYTTATSDSAPSYEGASEISNHTILAGAQVVPTTFVVPRSFVTNTPNRWYKTKAGTPESWSEVQGQFHFAPSASFTATLWWELHAEFEFQDAEPADMTPRLGLSTHGAAAAASAAGPATSPVAGAHHPVCAARFGDLRQAACAAVCVRERERAPPVPFCTACVDETAAKAAADEERVVKQIQSTMSFATAAPLASGECRCCGSKTSP